MSETVEEVEEEAPEISTEEEKARGQGWVDKEEFVKRNGSEEGWTNAGEFVRRGALMGKIKYQESEIARQNKAIENLNNNYKNLKSSIDVVQEATYAQAMADLKRQHQDAVREGDDAKAEKIVGQIEEHSKARQEPTPQEAAPTIAPELQEWIDQNQWFMNNKVLQEYAIATARKLDQQGLVGKELYSAAGEAVKEKFPEEFPDYKPKRKPAKVAPSGGSGSPKSGVSLSGLSDEQRNLYNEFREQFGDKEAKGILERWKNEGLIGD